MRSTQDTQLSVQIIRLSVGRSAEVEFAPSPLATSTVKSCDFLLPGGPGLTLALGRHDGCVTAIRASGIQLVNMAHVCASAAAEEVDSVAVAASAFFPLSRGRRGDTVPVCGTTVEGAIARALKASGATTRGQLQLGRVAGVLEPPAKHLDGCSQFPHGATGLHVLRPSRGGGSIRDCSLMVLTSHSGIHHGTRVFSLTPPPSDDNDGWSVREQKLDGDNLAHFIDRSSPTLAAAVMPSPTRESQSGCSGETLVQVTENAVRMVAADLTGSPTPRVWEWSPARCTDSSDNVKSSVQIEAAVIDPLGMRLVVSAGGTIFSHQLQCLNSRDGGFSGSEEWDGCGGQVSALALEGGGGAALLAFAVWRSNELGVVDAATLAWTHRLPVTSEGRALPDLCRSISFMHTTTVKQRWLLAGLASGVLQGYRMHDAPIGGDGTGVLQLSMTVSVGNEPVLLTAFDGGDATSPPFVYASSSRDVLVLPPEIEAEQRLQVVAMMTPQPVLCLASAHTQWNERQTAVWVDRPQPGCGLPCLRVASVLQQPELRWQTRKLPSGEEPKLLLADAATQTLLLVTEGGHADASAVEGRHLPRHARVQTVRLFDGGSLDQLGSMVLEAGHVVTALSAMPLNAPPSDATAARATVADFLVGSTVTVAAAQHLYKAPSSCKSFISVLRTILKRENEDSPLIGSMALVGQASLGCGPARTISAMCPFVDQCGGPACAIAHSCDRGGKEATTTISVFGVRTRSRSSRSSSSRTECGSEYSLCLVTAKVLMDTAVPSSLCSLLGQSFNGQHDAAAATSDGCGALLLASGVHGQTLLRWHTDHSRSAHLLIVAVDQLERSTGNQHGRAATGAILLPASGNDDAVRVVLSPLVGGLRVLAHRRADEMEPAEEERREMQLLSDEAVGGREQPDAAQSSESSSPETAILDRPCSLVEAGDLPPTCWATAPVMCIHDGMLGVMPSFGDSSDEDEREALVLCRNDGTVQCVRWRHASNLATKQPMFLDSEAHHVQSSPSG